jgi:hypothetical protein
MPRKKRPAAEAVVTPQSPEAIAAAEPTSPTPTEATRTEPDVFDQAIAARQAERVRAEEAVPPARQDESPTVATVGERKWQVQPDPHGIYSVALTDANHGPRIHLYRSRRYNQVAVKFDEKPPQPVRERMHDEGYRWREAEGVWTKQLGQYRASGQLAAERLVTELANAIRAEHGLAPAGQAVSA